MSGDNFSLRRGIDELASKFESYARNINSEIDQMKRTQDANSHVGSRAFRKHLKGLQKQVVEVEASINSLKRRTLGMTSLQELINTCVIMYQEIAKGITVLEAHLRNYGYTAVYPDPAPFDPFENLAAGNSDGNALGNSDQVQQDDHTNYGLFTPGPSRARCSIAPDCPQTNPPSVHPFNPQHPPHTAANAPALCDSFSPSLTPNSSLGEVSPTILALRRKYAQVDENANTGNVDNLGNAGTVPNVPNVGNGSNLATPLRSGGVVGVEGEFSFPNLGKLGAPGASVPGSVTRSVQDPTSQTGVASVGFSPHARDAGNAHLDTIQEDCPSNNGVNHKLDFGDAMDVSTENEQAMCQNSGSGGVLKQVISAQEYACLPAYLQSIVTLDQANQGLMWLSDAFRMGQGWVSVDAAQNAGLGDARNLFRCFTELGFVSREFRNGSMVFAPSEKLQGTG